MAGRPKRRAQDLLHRAVMARDNLSRIRHIARVIASQTARSNSGKGYGSRRITFADLIAGSDIRQGWLKELLESSPIYRAAPAPGRQIGVHATKAEFESEFWVDLLSAAKGSSRTWEEWQELAKNTLEYTSKRLFSDFKKLKHSPFGSGVPAASSGEDEFGRPGTEQHPGIAKSIAASQLGFDSLRPPEDPGEAWLKRAQVGTTQKYLTQFLNRPPDGPGEDAFYDMEDRKMAFLLSFWFLYEQLAGDQQARLKEVHKRVETLRREADEAEEDGYAVSADLLRREAAVLQKELTKYTKAQKALTDRMAEAKTEINVLPQASVRLDAARSAFTALERGKRVNKRVKNVYGYAFRDISEAIFEGGAMGLSMVHASTSEFRRMLGRISDEDWDDLGLRGRSPRSARRPRGKKI